MFSSRVLLYVLIAVSSCLGFYVAPGVLMSSGTLPGLIAVLSRLWFSVAPDVFLSAGTNS